MGEYDDCPGRCAPMSLNDLSTLLWREREVLELLLYKLQTQQLMLTTGRTEWLAVAAREVDAVVEIWNGMPFWSPLWFRGPRSVWLHHVHGEMWQMTLPGLLGRIGWAIESRLAPRFYQSRYNACIPSANSWKKNMGILWISNLLLKTM